MAPQQRLRALLLFARAHEADRAYVEALRYVDQGLEVAIYGHVWHDLADLLLYRAKLERAHSRYQAAIEDIEASLDVLRAHTKGDDETIDRSFRLELFTLLAEYEFFAGHFSEAENTIRVALQLVPDPSEHALEIATLYWTQARLDRLRGLPQRALLPLRQAIAIYETEAPLASQACLAVFTAETLMDLGEQSDDSQRHERTGFYHQAHTSAERANQLAQQARSPSSCGLARLALARQSRLCGQNADRQSQIERTIRLAHQLDDQCLLAQGFTALGDELAGQGEQEGALDCYRQTLGLLDGSEVTALAVPPWRKLLYASEMSPDVGLN
jgi:tetratricopeptide (TPR) repeat protein